MNANSTQSQATTTVITLVHGTFARDADWMKEGSLLSEALRKSFGAGLIVKPFHWSGGNSHHARMTASTDLREHLRQNLNEHPNAKHFVIGHSHGGNAILYALCDDCVRDRISGVVCLSTPFLHVRFVPFDMFPIVAAFWCLTVTAWMFLTIGAGELLGIGIMGLLVSGVLLAAVLVIAFFAVLINGERILEKIGVPAGSSAWQFEAMAAHELRLAELEPNALLLLRPTGDEASMALSSAQFIRWLLRQVRGAVEYLAFGLGRLLTRMIVKPKMSFAAALLYVYLLRLVILVLLVVFVLFPATRLVVGVVLACAFVPIVVGALLTVILLVGMALCHLVVGYDAAMWSMALETTVESAPLGTWNVVHINMPKGGLAHSQLYENEQALEVMTKWLQTR